MTNLATDTGRTAEEMRSHVHTWIGDDCPEGWRRVGSIDVADLADVVTACAKDRRIGTVHDGFSGSAAEPCCADVYARTELGKQVDRLQWKIEDLEHEAAQLRSRLLAAEQGAEAMRGLRKLEPRDLIYATYREIGDAIAAATGFGERDVMVARLISDARSLGPALSTEPQEAGDHEAR